MITERMLTVAEIAEKTKLSRKAIYAVIGSGELPARKLCGRIRVCASDYETWLDASRISPEQPPGDPNVAVRPRGLRRGRLRELLVEGGDHERREDEAG